jgi:L-amino acid N-acyltransferase YncA
VIRDARESDAAVLAAIYAHHVLHGTATYDLEPPTAEELAKKVRHVQAAGWPFIVIEEEGEVAGYAYATQIRDRAAYAWTAEDSIYVHPAQRGKGVGTALLEALCERAEAAGFRQMIGVIGGAEPASIRVHARCGFREVGRAYGVGWKHGRWLDNVYMQRALGKGSREAPPKPGLEG